MILLTLLCCTIQDTSSLPFLNPDLQERKSLKVRLDNGLEMLLISDPKAGQAAAALAVDAGSWNDPVEFPGMAHFCEHMLFMGTGKYPDENEFMALVGDYGGATNAMTLPDRTLYMFSSNEEGFAPLFDRFAHFFIDPLFKPTNISREMHAVDQEFAKSLQHDGWRSLMVFKETGNPDHPNRMFSCGNSQTLANIPSSALQQWHKDHYSADRMHAVIYAPMPLSVLQDLASKAFYAVPCVEKAADIDPTIPLMSAQQKGHIIYMTPILEGQSLILCWELPLSLADDDSLSAELIAYVLQRGQQNNLYEQLKQQQLIHDLSIQVDEIAGPKHRLFEISIELTEKGAKNVQLVLQQVFQSLSLVRQTGIPQDLFRERNDLARILYQYQSRKDPFPYVTQIARTLSNEPLAAYPSRQLLGSHYCLKKIAQAADFLRPENCSLFFLGSPEITQVAPEKKETWLGAEYAVKPIPRDWLTCWEQAPLHPLIHLPKPNPFIPAQLDLVHASEEAAEPVLVSESAHGIAYFARCPEFKTPTADIRLNLLSQVIQNDPRSHGLASIYCARLNELLHPTFSMAQAAGLKASVNPDEGSIRIHVHGFSEKAPLLFETILHSLACPPPTREQFETYATQLKDACANAQKNLSFRQANDLAYSLLLSNRATQKTQLSALEQITYEEFLIFQKNLLEKTYVQGFFAGNLSCRDVETAWLDVMHQLGNEPLPSAEHPKTAVATLPEGPYSISHAGSTQGNATLLVLDAGDFSHSRGAAQEILSIVLKEAFFNELRTRQKTGYIAFADGQEMEKRLFEFFVVQSNSHQPEDLLYRFELFLEEFLENFSDKITEARFKTLQENAALGLEHRFCNLKKKGRLLNMLAYRYGANFHFIQQRIDAIRALSYEEFHGVSKEILARSNKKRLAVLIKGTISEHFAYEPITPSELQEIALYSRSP